MVIHIFGKPDVGKTTLAYKLKEKLVSKNVVIIDAGDLRKTVNSDLLFDKKSRIENHRRVFELANYLDKQDKIIILCSINPYEEYRSQFYSLLDNPPVIIYLDCPQDILIGRDTKQLYSSDLTNLTGITDRFDSPSVFTLKFNTNEKTVEEEADEIIDLLFPKQQPKALFIGRWQPFHKGHQWLIDQKLLKGIPVLIGVRDVKPDSNNPYSTNEVILMIKQHYKDNPLVETIIIPDIESINYGRKVGYEVNEFSPPEDIYSISGTAIRNSIK